MGIDYSQNVHVLRCFTHSDASILIKLKRGTKDERSVIWLLNITRNIFNTHRNELGNDTIFCKRHSHVLHCFRMTCLVHTEVSTVYTSVRAMCARKGATCVLGSSLHVNLNAVAAQTI